MAKFIRIAHSDLLLKGIEFGDLDIIRLILNKGIPITSNAFNYAIRKKQPAILDLFTEAGIKPNRQSLNFAILTADPNLVKKVLGLGAFPTEDSLINAIYTKNPEIIKLISKLGVHLDEYTLTHLQNMGSGKLLDTVIDFGATPTPEVQEKIRNLR